MTAQAEGNAGIATALRTLLFDLDGTLVDTAPDLARAINQVLTEEGMAPMAYEDIRPHVSNGSARMVEAAFGGTPEDPVFEKRRRRFLDIYSAGLADESGLFDGMASVLVECESRGMNWGIVTNKPAWLTDPLVTALELDHRAACVISGDTTEKSKPHPLPLLHACELAGSQAAECLYVGDARRDIEAGQRAGMATLVALFGYIETGDDPATWGADGMVEHASDIMNWVDSYER